METDVQVDALLKQLSFETNGMEASALNKMCDRTVQRVSTERKLRTGISYGVIPSAVLLGALTMWLMQVSAWWITGGLFANALLAAIFWLLVKRMLR